MDNRKSQREGIHTNCHPSSNKSDSSKQQNPQRQQNHQRRRQQQKQQHHQPKAHGGDDVTPSGRNTHQTHNRFHAVSSVPFGVQSDHTVGSNLESVGNRRPLKAPFSRKCSSQVISEEIEQIRITMKCAYENIIDPNTAQPYKPKTAIEDLNFYFAKLIGRLSKEERQHEERRTNGSNGANRKPDGEILKITKQIKKLFRNISNGTTNKEENEPDSAENMLKIIEQSFRQCQQQIEWYKQEKDKVETEIEKLANDVIDADVGIEKGIHEQINYIRLQMEQQKRKYLESHKEKFVKVEDWNELRECRKTLQKEIEELKEEKDVLLNRLKELENRSQNNRQVLGDLCTLLKIDLEPRQKGGSNDNWKVIVENMKRLVKDKDQFVDHAGKLLNDLSTLITREPFSLTFSGHSDTKRVQVQEPDFQHLVSGMHNVKLCLEDYRESHKEKFVKIEAWNELKECKKRLQKQIEELKEEKDVLLNRLSKMAGANLTDNNPAIADLSDPNRATKLAEQFSELYDNSWTDAYEVLDISDEKECIQYLLNIIVESYSMCAGISNNQQRVLARALHYPTEGLSIKTITNEVSHDSGVNLSKLQSRTLSDLRKTYADLSIVDVKTYITAKNENWVRKGELKQFTLSCIELCWFMHLQSPPVYLDAALVAGSTFDTNKYKPYTKSGKEIDFIVWPSLYLHKGGPILCKGVAQGK